MKSSIVTALLLAAAQLSAAQISPEFFAMHALSTQDPWPTSVGVQFSSWRSVSSKVTWADINTSQGVYDWSHLDQLLALAGQNGQSVMYTFYYTPTWASACPTCTCNQGNQSLGGCYPPNDLNSDGSGSDQHLKDFITALMQHEGPGKIKYIEIWNEPNIPTEWGGTMPQIVRMTQDVRSVAQSFDPNVLITSPPETGDGKNSLKMVWLPAYFAAGGGQYVDVIGLHGYTTNPEDIITRVANTTAAMAQYAQSGKPIFITEGSWCCEHTPIPSSQQPGFSFRQYLSMLSTPVSQYYLFAFDSANEGNLWDSTHDDMTANGAAYQLYYGWLMGATMTQPCQPYTTGSAVWSCTFSRSGGYQAAAVWDTVTNVTVPVSSLYVQYRDLSGNVHAIKNHQVPIGYTPIWLEN
ncbi:MAG TPA: glycosyl hydrolase [Terriglobales bacterium]|nr:glycosyl hydrolase [Terriglobales bacterium]